jgi:hypothetical protein
MTAQHHIHQSATCRTIQHQIWQVVLRASLTTMEKGKRKALFRKEPPSLVFSIFLLVTIPTLHIQLSALCTALFAIHSKCPPTAHAAQAVNTPDQAIIIS